MSFYYLDSSALIKHYVAEAGSQWMDAVIFDPPDNILLTSRVTAVEVRSAFARRRREASISSSNHADALDAFREDCLMRLRFVEFEESVVDLAGQLLESHSLRAYDAVQLASAMLVNQLLMDADLDASIFVSADGELLAIAEAEGLQVEDPNLHS